MQTLLAVTFISAADGQETISRIFQTLHAARRWAIWLASQRFASNVRIMAGGAGGVEVK